MRLKPVVPSVGVRHFSVNLGNGPIEVVTKTGLPDWALISPATHLLAECTSINPNDSILLYGCYQGALAVYLARMLPTGQLSVTDINHSALVSTQMTLAANNITSVSFLVGIELPQELHNRFNSLIIQIPKGRLLSRRWLLQAHTALVIGGTLYIGGANNSGIQSVIKDAQELFTNGRILAYKKGNRVAQFIKQSVGVPLLPWSQIPGIAQGTWVEFTVTLSSHTFRIRSLPGVFSYDHLDEGTKMLLSVINIPPGARVLDIGCGYGLLGLCAAVEGAELVHLIDTNLLAVASSRETITLNRITNAEVFAVDLLDQIGTNRYDLILSNPPFHTGHAVDYQIAQAMIDQSFQALSPRGQMIIVANRFIRYDHLIKSIFGNVSTLIESGKFHVLSGLKSR